VALVGESEPAPDAIEASTNDADTMPSESTVVPSTSDPSIAASRATTHPLPYGPYSKRYYPRNQAYRLSRDVLREIAASTLDVFEKGFYYPPTSGIAEDATDEGRQQPVDQPGGEGKEPRSEQEIGQEVKEEGTKEEGTQEEDNEAKEAVEEQNHEAQGEGENPEARVEDDLEEVQGREEKDQGRQPYDLKSRIIYTISHTQYFGPEDERLSRWADSTLQAGDSTVAGDNGNQENPEGRTAKTKIIIGEYSTLVGARRMHEVVQAKGRIGVLNFASAKKPGGGFINGSQAQVCFISHSRTSIF